MTAGNRSAGWRPALFAGLAALSLASVASAVETTSAAAIAAKKTAIVDYLHTLEKQHRTLVGVQVNEFEVYLDCDSADRLRLSTGKRPAVLGLELMGAIAVPPYAGYVVDRARTQTAAGGLVALTWHHRNPTEICVRGEFFDCVKMPMSADTMKAMLTKGTAENKAWLADVDALAKVLGKLREAGVVVLFRPYHEMNGGWFWWGKKDAYPALWDALYDELAVRRTLDNLIWVWSSDRDTPDAARYAPRRHRPDVAGIDVYEQDPANPKFAAGHANLKAVFGNAMPFAITEVGRLPGKAVIDAVNPIWVLLWGGEYIDSSLRMGGACKDCNTPDKVAEFVAMDRTLMLDEMPPALRAAVKLGTKNLHPLRRGKPACPVKPH
jgi:hypothetical protein